MAEPQSVTIRLRYPEKVNPRLLALLARYTADPNPQGELRYVLAAEFGSALVELFDGVELLGATKPLPTCNRCWEPPTEKGFHSHATLEREVDFLVGRCKGAIERHSIGTSSEGRDLVAIRMPAASGTANKRMLVVGCHHGEEWISVEVAFRFAMSVLDGSSGIPSDVLRNTEVWAVPMANPDGHSFSVKYDRGWRKSRSSTRDAGGLLHFGVDLNRNYPIGFGLSGMSSSEPSSGMYHGAAPFSEPETAALRGLCCAQRFDGVLSLHANGREILYPWAHLLPDSNRREVEPLCNLAVAMADSVNLNGGSYVPRQASTFYESAVGGDFCDWAFDTFRKPAITIELGPSNYEMRLPGALIDSVFDEIRPAFSTFFVAL